jgi:hypothetical protein
MSVDKESLAKLLRLVEEVAEQAGNEWFKAALKKYLDKTVTTADPRIAEIYELCIGKVIDEQSAAFYKDFPLGQIKSQLIFDHARMERYRRENDIENFCLAAYQQLEYMVNHLANDSVGNYIQSHAQDVTHIAKNPDTNILEDQRLWESIFWKKMSTPKLQDKFYKGIKTWHFAEKLKAVTFYYLFSRDLSRYVTFNLLMADGTKLANLRNTIHRGSTPTPEQLKVAQEVKAAKERYYIRFLAFLDQFTGLIYNPVPPPLTVTAISPVKPLAPQLSGKLGNKNVMKKR